MKNLTLVGAVIGTLCVPSLAFGAGFAVTTHSATSTALGGSGAANPDEPNSSYYNPATMTLREGINVYVGVTAIAPAISYEGPNGETEDATTPVVPPPNFHIAFPFTENFAAGVGVTFPYGLTVEYPREWIGREVIQRQQLTAADINPNVAYEIPGTNLSLSLGAQIFLASLRLERTTILRDDVEVDADLGGSGTGFGVTAAAFYQPTDNVSIGLNYRSGTTLSFDGVAHFENEEGTPFESSFIDQDISTELNLPHTVTAGLGFEFDKVFVGLDVGYTTWSDYDRVDVQFTRDCEVGDAGCEPGVDTSPATTSILAFWEDAFVFRLGAQYEVIEDLQLRVGGAYDMTPIPAETVAPSLPGNDRAVLTAGVGYTWNKIRADLGYMYIATNREITNGSLDGDYKTTANLLSLNLGYGF